MNQMSELHLTLKPKAFAVITSPKLFLMAAQQMPQQSKEHDEAGQKLLENCTPTEREAARHHCTALIEDGTDVTDRQGCTVRSDAQPAIIRSLTAPTTQSPQE